MDTVTVLRLEDANGGGCFAVASMQDYTAAAVAAGLMTVEEDSYEHFHTSQRGCPGPSADPLLTDDAAHKGLDYFAGRFGFASQEQAREWFPACMEAALRANKQTLTVWEVPTDSVAFGERQVVFDHHVAHLKERLDVAELWEREIN